MRAPSAATTGTSCIVKFSSSSHPAMPASPHGQGRRRTAQRRSTGSLPCGVPVRSACAVWPEVPDLEPVMGRVELAGRTGLGIEPRCWADTPAGLGCSAPAVAPIAASEIDHAVRAVAAEFCDAFHHRSRIPAPTTASYARQPTRDQTNGGPKGAPGTRSMRLPRPTCGPAATAAAAPPGPRSHAGLRQQREGTARLPRPLAMSAGTAGSRPAPTVRRQGPAAAHAATNMAVSNQRSARR